MNIPDFTDVTNHEQVVRHLLEAGADVNKPGPQGYSYLMVAAQNGHADVRTYK